MTSPTFVEENDSISLKTVFLSLSAVVVVVSVVVAAAVCANNYRRQQIVNQYTQEANQLARENAAAFRDFFSQTFDTCADQLDSKNMSVPESQAVSRIPCEAAQKQLSLMRVDKLKDSSAMAYFKYHDGQCEMITASGEYRGRSPISEFTYSNSFDGNQKAQIIDYFNQQKPMNMWQDFGYFLPGKEVLVPIEIDGQIIGYIFRGVIER